MSEKEWISIEERLPEERKPVWVYTEALSKYDVGICWRGDWWEPNEEHRLYRVTHWMPLPDPPTKEAK